MSPLCSGSTLCRVDLLSGRRFVSQPKNFANYQYKKLYDTDLSNGTGPCYLNVDLESGFVFAADYDGSAFTSYRLDPESGL